MRSAQFYFGRGGVLYMRTPDGRALKMGLRLRRNVLQAYDPVRRAWHDLPAQILNKQNRRLVHLTPSSRTSHGQIDELHAPDI